MTLITMPFNFFYGFENVPYAHKCWHLFEQKYNKISNISKCNFYFNINILKCKFIPVMVKLNFQQSCYFFFPQDTLINRKFKRKAFV